MLFDANKGDEDSFTASNYDVCIVGAGAAGIILALTLANKGMKIAILEGGGFEASVESQELYKGDVGGLGLGQPDADRLRYLGGTTGHWAGQCVQLDEHDFEKKAYSPNTGWPITLKDIETYLEEAKSWLETGSTVGAQDPLKKVRGTHFTSIVKPVSESKDNIFAGGPTRFGTKYREALVSHPQIALLLNTNALRVHLESNERDIGSLQWAALNGESKGVITARQYVLCMGGLETPRFLLNSDKRVLHALGVARDNIGRFLGWHPTVQLGHFLLDWDRIRKHNLEIHSWATDENPAIAYLVPSKNFMQREKILNFLMHIEILKTPQPKTPSLTDKAKAVLCETDFSARLAQAVYGKIWQCESFRYDGVIQFLYEQHPLPESRVSLATDRDRFGLRKIKIQTQLDPNDFRTIQRAALEIGRTFANHGIGRVKLEDWIAEGDSSRLLEYREGSLWHPMGTTRMSDSPKTGVVDPSLKVFGTNNLFICSSSVFPTFGHANPTLTIAQLALRLANKLATMSTPADITASVPPIEK